MYKMWRDFPPVAPGGVQTKIHQNWWVEFERLFLTQLIDL